MTKEEVNKLFHDLGGQSNKRFWELHIAEAYRIGKEQVGIGQKDIFTHCIEVAYAQYLAEQLPVPLDDIEYQDILQAQEIYDAL